tara:strand:+ start:195 stop:302 length:108 start_codon:yes stop_codon:yes gene_type:complete
MQIINQSYNKQLKENEMVMYFIAKVEIAEPWIVAI